MVEVIEDHDPRPHKPVSFEVPCQKDAQDASILKAQSRSQESVEGKIPSIDDSVRGGKKLPSKDTS